ncbi:MAG TPA: ABC transporter ATP-binding protein [Planctomycetota bacterium]|nr:ABC transporter ATP-binding protein [Planctomycetota bacterium]
MAVRDLVKVYSRGSRDVIALDGVSFTVEEGESVAIMGPSGSGKSTLMGLLGCLERPSRGEYRLDGTLVSDLDDPALSRIRNRRVGFVFQSFHLIPQLSVLENVETPLLYAGVDELAGRARALRALERVGLLSRAEHRPSELSGGEAQRAAIARAIVSEPRILLADEPTGNLDSATGEEVASLIEALHRDGRTVILVTHNEALGQRAERVIRLRDGRIESEQRP